MNYLLHLAIADPIAEAPRDFLVGTLLPDFLKGHRIGPFEGLVQKGFELHRKIDVFSDAHPSVIRSKRRLSPQWRHHSGILVDIYYDHLLSTHWSRISSVALSTFIARTYQILAQPHAAMTPLMRQAVHYMIAEDWLGSYATHAGVALTLARISKRFKRPVQLDEAIGDLIIHHDAMMQDFEEFLPAILAQFK
jgi:acyl carrier protein phosphodiesterase